MSFIVLSYKLNLYYGQANDNFSQKRAQQKNVRANWLKIVF